MNTKGYLFEVVSTMAFLVGVSESVFDNEYQPPRREVYDKLTKIKAARIIRNLSILRTAIWRNFKRISERQRDLNASMYGMDDLIPLNVLESLAADGVIVPEDKDLNNRQVQISKLVKERIENVKDLFPEWLEWDYVKDLFVFKGGLSVDGVKQEGVRYQKNKSSFPYACYMNIPTDQQGNVLYNDEKFVKLLYQWNDDIFLEDDKVTTITDSEKKRLEEFFEDDKQVELLVDGENVDWVKLLAVVRTIESDEVPNGKDTLLTIFDDPNSQKCWEEFSKMVDDVRVNYIKVDRLLTGKSLVDTQLIAYCCKRVYSEGLERVIVASSDSDFSTLIRSLPPSIEWIFLVERDKVSPTFIGELEEKQIQYFYMDDFDTNGADFAKTAVVVRKMNEKLARVQFDVEEALNETLRQTGVRVTESEWSELQRRVRRLDIQVVNGMIQISLAR